MTLIYLSLLALNNLKYAQLKSLSIVLIAVLFAQIGLGITNSVLHLPVMLAVGHNFGDF